MQQYIRYGILAVLICFTSCGVDATIDGQDLTLHEVVEIGYTHNLLDADAIDLYDKMCAGHELSEQECERLSDVYDYIMRYVGLHSEQGVDEVLRGLREPKPEDADDRVEQASYVPRDINIRRIKGFNDQPIEFLSDLDMGGSTIEGVALRLTSDGNVTVNYDTDGNSDSIFELRQNNTPVFRANSSGTLEAESDLNMKGNNISGIQPASGVTKNVSLLDLFNSVANARVGFYTLSNGLSDDVDFATELADPGGNFSLANDRYVVPEDGLYLIMATITVDAGSFSGNIIVRLRLNASSNLDEKATSTSETLTLVVIQNLSADDNITLNVDNNSGGQASLSNASLWAMRVG